MSDPKCKHGKTVLFCDECYSRESGRQMSSYEAWRISFQDSEQAAKAAFNQVQTLQHSLATAERERDILADKVQFMGAQLVSLEASREYLLSQTEEFRNKRDEAKRELAELRRGVEVTRSPSKGLMVSIAMRLHHDFGLLTDRRKELVLSDVRRMFDEISGNGFYRPEKESEYATMWPQGEE